MYAAHRIYCLDEKGEVTSKDWQKQLNTAAKDSSIAIPKIITLTSPFRFITSPILEYTLEIEKQFPHRKIAVIIPELVTTRWYQYLLHNHRSTVLKALLLLQGNRRIIIINVPWYLDLE